MAKKSTKSTKSKPSSGIFDYKKFNLTFKQTVASLIILSVLLLGVSGWFWWRSILTDPDRVLSDMLRRSLQTTNVTRNVTQQDQQSSLNQSVRLFLAPDKAAQTVTVLSQKGPDGISKVTTETLGTQSDDFIRYRSIESSEKVDKSALGNVLNVWSKRESGGQPPTFLNEAILGLVPFGNLKKPDRQIVLDILEDKKVYNYSKTTLKSQNGRKVLSYEMSIAPQGLVEALAAYSKLSGLGEQPQLDPKSYASVPPVNAEVTIDIISRDLVSIKYTDSARLEEYQSAGLRNKVPVPGQTIAFTELQKRLQGLQKK